MQRTRLGRSDLLVSRICFGTWQFGGDWGEVDRDEALAAVRSAREQDITFFDTAQGYGFGQAEEILAEGLASELKRNRDELVIATKGGLRMEGDDLLRDSSPRGCARAWSRAWGTWASTTSTSTRCTGPTRTPPSRRPRARSATWCARARSATWACRTSTPSSWPSWSATSAWRPSSRPYHLFRRDFEHEELPWCREHDVGVLVYGPLAHGLLSGRFQPGDELPEDDWRSGTDLFSGEAFERNLQVVGRLGEMADQHGLTVAQLAVAWTLAQPGVHCAIVGRPASRPHRGHRRGRRGGPHPGGSRGDRRDHGGRHGRRRPVSRDVTRAYASPMQPGEDTAALLASVEIFADLEERELAEIASVAVPRSFDRGEILFREGDRGDTCYVVRSGAVIIRRQHGSDSGAVDHPGRVPRRGLLRRAGHVRRRGPLGHRGGDRAHRGGGAAQRRHAAGDARLAPDRLQDAHRHGRPAAHGQRAADPAVLPDRVRAGGGHAAGPGGRRGRPREPATREVLVQATQAEIAQLAGTSRESASRFLASLEREGVVALGRGKVTVHEPERLRNYIH